MLNETPFPRFAGMAFRISGTALSTKWTRTGLHRTRAAHSGPHYGIVPDRDRYHRPRARRLDLGGGVDDDRRRGEDARGGREPQGRPPHGPHDRRSACHPLDRAHRRPHRRFGSARRMARPRSFAFLPERTRRRGGSEEWRWAFIRTAWRTDPVDTRLPEDRRAVSHGADAAGIAAQSGRARCSCRSTGFAGRGRAGVGVRFQRERKRIEPIAGRGRPGKGRFRRAGGHHRSSADAHVVSWTRRQTAAGKSRLCRGDRCEKRRCRRRIGTGADRAGRRPNRRGDRGAGL